MLKTAPPDAVVNLRPPAPEPPKPRADSPCPPRPMISKRDVLVVLGTAIERVLPWPKPATWLRRPASCRLRAPVLPVTVREPVLEPVPDALRLSEAVALREGVPLPDG